jgi:hypothetical protein
MILHIGITISSIVIYDVTMSNFDARLDEGAKF